MNEQKEPQNTPIELTDDELAQVNGGRGNNEWWNQGTLSFSTVCTVNKCKNIEVVKKTNVFCKVCPYMDLSKY